MNPGRSAFTVYSMCGASSASIATPLTSTMRGLSPNRVPATVRLRRSVVTVKRIIVWYSSARSWLISVTSMLRSRATWGAFTTLTASSIGESKPVNAQAVRG